jgi:hypothetical protein
MDDCRRTTVAPTSTRSKNSTRLPARRALSSGCRATARANVAITNPLHDTGGCESASREPADQTLGRLQPGDRPRIRPLPVE